VSVEDLIGAYGTSYDELRLGTGAFVEQLWLELGGPDDVRALEFAETALAVVDDANASVGTLVDEYIGEYAATVSRRPPPAVDPLDLAELAVDRLRGAPGLEVYQRPAVTVRRLLADGTPYEDAMATAATRAGATAEADVALAHREAARDSMERRTPGAAGYRRVLTGSSCTLCRIASTQRYRNAELMPIHPRCDCRVAPVLDGYDGGRIVNRELYRELKANGELEQFNARNRGTTGAGRARTAQARRERRAAQASTEGTQTALDLRRPDQAPVVRQHGELGPVLVDERHRFTGTRRASTPVTDVDDLATRRPVRPPTDSPDRPPNAPPAAAPAKQPRWTVESPDVLRAASRRNVAPERVVADLEAKRARRLAEQAADRAEAKHLTAASPQVVEVADRFGVSGDEVLAARGQVAAVRRTIADEATRVQLDAFERLDDWDARSIGRPPKGARGGEWDFLDGLDSRERGRLSRRFYDDTGIGPDVIADQMRNAAASRVPFDITDSDAMDLWLEQTRRYEAAGAIRRGRVPSGRAYSGNVDVDTVLGDIADGYTPSQIVGKPDLEAAGAIAARNRTLAADEAIDYLGAAYNPTVGTNPYRMSFQSWEAEVRELEYALRNYPDELEPDRWQRLAELVPEYLDEPGTSYEELYTRIVTTARHAGEDVPGRAVIPWADDVAPPIVPPEGF